MVRAEMRKEAREALKGRWGKAIGFYLISTIIIMAILAVSEIPAMDTVLYWVLFVAYFAIMMPISYIMVLSFMKYKRGEDIGLFDVILKLPENFVAGWKIVWGIFMKMWIYWVALMVLFVAAIVIMTANSELNALGEIIYIPAWAAFTSLLLFLATFIVSIFAAMKGLHYIFTWEVMFDSGNSLKGKEAAEKSEELMQGKRRKFFMFMLSFIGWAFLAAVVGYILIAIVMSVIISPEALTNQTILAQELETIMWWFVPVIGMVFSVAFMWVSPYISVSSVVFYDRLVEGNKKEEKPE